LMVFNRLTNGLKGLGVAALMIAALLPLGGDFVRAAEGESTNGNEWKPSEGAELIGTAAPPWRGLQWIQGGPLRLEDLMGKVVLVRFWLVGCHYCLHSAPALNEFYEKYQKKGLVVVGIHHPKSSRTRDPEVVRSAVGLLGFKFPIALDNGWDALRSYWLNGGKRSFTSVSFLIDKSGVIRFVHDGGEYYRSKSDAKANSAYEAIDKKISELLLGE